jgi:hypothetical protein
MGNNWTYALLVKREQEPVVTGLERTVRIAEDAGYSPFDPDTAKIHVHRLDPSTLDSTYYQLDDLAAASQVMQHPGTVLTLWKGEVDISLSLDMSGQSEEWTYRVMHLDDKPIFGRISLVASDYDVRRDVSGRQAVDRDLRGIFTAMCIGFNAVYGFSSDENVFEHFLDQFQIHMSAHERRLPKVLFWLNYFSQEYIDAIGLQRFSAVEAQVQPTKTGYMITIVPHPWEATLDAMIDINRAWTSTATDTENTAYL